MSVAKMKKLDVFTIEPYSADLAASLVKLRCVDIEATALREGVTSRYDASEDRISSERRRDRVGQAIAAVAPYVKKKKKMFAPKQKADLSAFASSSACGITYNAAEAVCDAVARRAGIDKEIAAVESSERAAAPWLELDFPLEGVSTQKTSTVIGSVPPHVTDSLLESKLEDEDCAFMRIGAPPTNRLLFFCPSDGTDALVRKLAPLGFVEAVFPDGTGTAAEEMKRLGAKKKELEAESASIESLLSESAMLTDNFEILWDLEQTKVREAELRERFARTSECVQLSGFVPEKNAEKVEDLLKRSECAYEFSDPDPEEGAPVLLENNRFARNFEWVVAMYSLPRYGTYDPTFIMSICYSILFSIMFADVGYGLLLALGGFILPRVLHLGDSTSRAFRMFGICGIFCIVTGVLFGGYFGDLPLAFIRSADPGAEIPKTLAIIVDPTIDPMKFLIIGLAVGFVHLVTGQVIKFALVWKKSKLDAIFDYAFFWIIYTGIILMILVPNNIGLYVAGAGAVLVVLTAGRKEKNLLMRLPKGLLGLYGLVNFGSDIISYARILAIALSGTVLAQVFNILATFSRSPVFMIIGTPIILLIGHILNLALSALSAFVHTSRLQYVEFFGKFYEDGGKPFTPAVPSSKYTVQE